MLNAASKVISINADSLMANGERQENLKDILVAGCEYFDKFQYSDALQCFTKALSLDPTSEEARLGYNRVIQRVVPRWHFSMLNDHRRNDSYDTAIRKTVKGKTVLDVGSGSGLLALMASRAGAKKVYTCEMNEIIADFAEMIVSANGHAENIKVISKKSDDLVLGHDITEKVDVLITETIDSALLGEGIIPIILDARKRLLVEGGKIIPNRARMYAALLEAQEVWEMNSIDVASGFDINLFNHLATDGFYPVRLERFEHNFLTKPFELCQFDFIADTLEPHCFDIPITVTQNGKCHAVAYWFDLYLDEQTSFSTSPNNRESHWKQAIQCFVSPIPLQTDQEWALSVQQDLTGFSFNLIQS